ncbi:hypothetical protein BGZ58_001876 [Dissophora ornata]|nr:hypothetical protein BGZ58_001876 [Dissophora ornata]
MVFLVCLRAGGDPNAPDSVLFPIEIKRPALLRPADFVGDYRAQEQASVATSPVRALKQIFGYMRLNGYQYVLSCGEVEETLVDENRPDDKRKQDDSQYKPKKSRFKDSYPPYRLDPLKTRSGSKDTSQVVVPTFDSMELISHGEHAQTYKASWQGCGVVVKKCDIWNERPVMEELKHEAEIYHTLRNLQGQCIPKLKIAGIADGMEMILVTNYERLEESGQEKTRAALSAIHDLGVVHGDILPQNIVVQRDGPNAQFYFVDFGSSWIAADQTDRQWDTDILERLLQDMTA